MSRWGGSAVCCEPRTIGRHMPVGLPIGRLFDIAPVLQTMAKRFWQVLAGSAAALLLLLLLSPLAGCYFVSFEDASRDPRYADVVGKTFRSNERVAIHGISMDRNYARILDHYVVTALPGIGGREVLSHRELGIGTILRVIRVMRCTDCYLDFAPRVHAVVAITSPSAYNDARVEISLDLLVGQERVFVDTSP